MPGIKISVEPEIINWIFKNAFTNEAPLEVFNTLENWKNGTIQPTFRQVEKISNKIHVPFGYFFLKTPPKEELPVLEYRTIDSATAGPPSRNVVDTINYAESVQDWVRNYQIANGSERLDFVGLAKNRTSPDEIATTVRKALNLKLEWFSSGKNIADNFKFIRSRLESIGVLVFIGGVVGSNTHRKLDISEFRAFTLVDEFAPLIFINGNDSDGAKLFSLLHEAIHIWLGIDSFFNVGHSNNNNLRDVEKICNAATAELLVPDEIFIAKWAQYSKQLPSKKDVINKLATMFMCGVTTLARRAKDHKYISSDLYTEIAEEAIELYKQFLKNRGNGGNFYNTNANHLDARFLLMLDSSVREGKTQYTDAYRLTNLNRSTFSQLIEQVKGNRR